MKAIITINPQLPRFLDVWKILDPEVMDVKPGTSLADVIIRYKTMRSTNATVSEDSVNGQVVVKVLLSAQGVDPYVWEMTFLPDKDFLPLKLGWKFYNQTSYSEGDFRASFEAHFDASSRIDGLWVPSKIFGELSNYNGHAVAAFNRYDIEIKDFSLKSPEPAEMDIPLAADTHIIDLVTNDIYNILPNGSKQPVPFFDTDTGKIVDPPSRQKQ